MLEDLTGVRCKEYTLDYPEVLSLFDNTKALGLNLRTLME
jgi:DNA polymerase III alpha subunit (gram-positive type)